MQVYQDTIIEYEKSEDENQDLEPIPNDADDYDNSDEDENTEKVGVTEE